MPKPKYSHEARDDLAEIKRYIENDLANPIAARNTVTNIRGKIRKLESTPWAGTVLHTPAGDATIYRFLVCGNYLAIYRTEGEAVLVVRILYGKRECVTTLLHNPVLR